MKPKINCKVRIEIAKIEPKTGEEEPFYPFALPLFPYVEYDEMNLDMIVFNQDFAVFGRRPYAQNLVAMQNRSIQDLPNVSCRPATTSESISIADLYQSIVKSTLLDPTFSYFQLGKIAIASEGVYANMPIDRTGKSISDEAVLRSFLDKCKKIDRIWLYQGKDPRLRDFGFAPYDSFNHEVSQDPNLFCKEGLARLLEHSKGPASNFRNMTWPHSYKFGVEVLGFHQESTTKDNPARVATLSSANWFNNGYKLKVCGYQTDDLLDGFACGILNKGKDQ